MEAAALIRTASFSSHPTGDQISFAGGYLLRRSRSTVLSPQSAIHAELIIKKMESDSNREVIAPNLQLRRTKSDTDMIGSGWPAAALSVPAKVLEKAEEEETEGDLDLGVSDLAVALPEAEASGGGTGKGTKIGGAGDRSDEPRRIGEQYRQMLRSDPGNPLLLRNYGQFLHEVEGDVKGAEEYYGRAILASPGDGDVLSLYGKLVWEAHKDGERAESYFERAVEASPDDCFVLGSYARFLWDAEEENEDNGEERREGTSSPLVEAF